MTTKERAEKNGTKAATGFVDSGDYVHGLTKREYIAALALQGMLANPEIEASYDDFAKDSVGFADALLEALEKEGD